ncbi:MAG: hypothetical protein RL518_702 [Pseudomonadota bacterium]|jgi:DNA-binding Lrp family transcriptional regulator
MKLSEAQRRILLHTLLRADTPESQIARDLHIKEHIVRRTVKLFLDNGIFRRRSIFVNPHALGLVPDVVNISLPLLSQKYKQDFVDILCNTDEVGAVVELGGESHIELRTFTRDPEHRRELFENLAERFPHPFHLQTLLSLEEQDYSGTGAPDIPTEGRPILHYKPLQQGTKPFTLEDRDHQILYALANEHYHNRGQLARHLAMPLNTLSYRIQYLEKAGIILGHYYIVDIKAIQDLPVCFRLQSRVLSAQHKQALRAFCRKHPQIAWLSFFFGGQSAEIFTYVSNYTEANVILAEISKHFEGVVDSVTLTPQIQFYKYSTYPMKRLQRSPTPP